MWLQYIPSLFLIHNFLSLWRICFHSTENTSVEILKQKHHWKKKKMIQVLKNVVHRLRSSQILKWARLKTLSPLVMCRLHLCKFTINKFAHSQGSVHRSKSFVCVPRLHPLSVILHLSNTRFDKFVIYFSVLPWLQCGFMGILFRHAKTLTNKACSAG